MTICKYYLQGNCRFGNRCWNEHIDSSSSRHGESAPLLQHYERDAAAKQPYYSNDYSDYYSRYSYHNPRYSPPSAQSPFLATPQRSSSDAHLSRQGASFSFTKAYEEVTSREENQFAVLNDHNEIKKTTVKETKETKNNEIESLKDDMMRWELGKQWPFSCYAPFKIGFPGFEDISPEELRWKYYDSKDSGTLNIYIENVSEHAEKMALKRNEIKNATPQILEKLKSLQSGPKQQGSVFGNVHNKTSSSSIFGNKTIFGNEKTQQQNSTGLNTFRFSLSNVSEQPKSSFRLPQFGTQNNQVNLFGNSDDNTSMEISAFDFKDSGSGKTPLFGTGKEDSGSGKSPFFGAGRDLFMQTLSAQQRPSSGSTGTSIGLCNNTDSSKFHQASDVSEFIYTEVKLLSKSEKEEYTSNAEKFVLGNIPAQPPPKEFCF